MFFLVDAHGESLGKFSSRDEAIAASDDLREADPFAEVAVVETDSSGSRVNDVSSSFQYQ
jgi:hypothetical protein